LLIGLFGHKLLKRVHIHDVAWLVAARSTVRAECCRCIMANMSGAAAGAVESSPEQTRVQFGQTIRQLKHHWKLGVLLVPLLQLPAATPLGVEPAAASDRPAAAGGGSEGGRNAEGQMQQQADAVQGLFAAAAGFGLEDCWQWKPLLDGKQVGTSQQVDVQPAALLVKNQSSPICSTASCSGLTVEWWIWLPSVVCVSCICCMFGPTRRSLMVANQCD
jgi:hypothetical protein